VGTAFALSLLLWEGILRLTVLSPSGYAQHPQLGWSPRPFGRSFNGTEGWAQTRFNEWGLRDRRIEPKQPGEFRILCLGDSYTVSGAVSEEKTFPRRLEALLSTAAARASLPGRPASVRVINGGRVGINAVYSIGLAETYQRLFQPDWVVLQVRDYGDTVFDPVHEFRYERVGTRLKLHHRWHTEEMGKLKRLLLESRIRDAAVAKLGFQRLQDMVRLRSDAGEAGPSVATSPALQAVSESVRELRRRYPRLVLIHFPYGAPENADLLPCQPEEAEWVEAARRNAVPMISLRHRFGREYAATHRPPYGFANTLPWTGHPNEYGYRLAAEELADFFTHSVAGSLAPHGDERQNPLPRPNR